MQTTLLGLGIAIILALIAALVGPYFVDWTGYRQTFEARAREAFGAPVHIGGRIDLRLLPTPYVVLRDVELAQPEEGAHLRARELEVTFSLASLMRGAWRATELRLEGPDVGLRFGKDGHLVWPGRQAHLDPASVSIDRLIIDHGRLELHDAASGAHAVLEEVSFDGDARSLLGPVRGEGGFVFDGRQHALRLAAGRASPAGNVKLRLGFDRAQDPLGVEVDGTLNLGEAKPRFDGTIAIARDAGVVLVAGRAIANQPWRLSGRVKLGAAEALIEQLELIYGPEERALKLTGTADLKLGAQPRLDAVLSAHQLDLDKFVGLPEARRSLPAVALRAAARMMQGAHMPTLPVRIGIGIDAVTIGKGTVTDLRGDVRSDAAGGWEIETVEFRAPGLTRVRASGRLSALDDGYAFTGPARVDAADPRMLTAWLEGRTTPRGPAAAPLRAQGEVTFTPQRLAVERLSAEVDRNPISGRFDYAWPAPTHPRPRLEAELKTKELDVDATLKLLSTALPGASLELPGEIVLALDIGRATMAGVEAIDTKAKLRLDADGLVLEQVRIGDLAGVSLAVSGRIEGPWERPAGSVVADVEGTRLDGVAALLGKIAPKPAAWLSRKADRLAPAKLHLSLTLQRQQLHDSAGSAARLAIDGEAGALRLALGAEAKGTIMQWQSARLRTDGRVETDDARALAAILGIEPILGPASGAGALRWLATGPLGGSLGVQGQFTAPGAELSANGTLGLGGDIATGARAEVVASIADVAALRKVFGRPAGRLPVAVRAQLSFDDDRVLFSGVSGKVADSAISGRLTLTLADPLDLNGRLEVDNLDATALVGALAGAPASRERTAPAALRGEPFGPRFLSGVKGYVALSAASAKLSPGLEIRDVSAGLNLTPGEVSFDDIEGRLGGGRLQGSLSLQTSPLGTALAARVAVSGADIAALWPKEAGASARGRISFQLDAKGHGRSPAALIGSLGGTGRVSFEQVEVPGLSAEVFAAAIRSADQRDEVVADAVKAAVAGALDHGTFKAARVDGALTLTAGQLRTGNLTVQGERADVSVNATLDLLQSQLDARLALFGNNVESLGVAGRPGVEVLLHGPFDAPRRDIDVSGLVGWLTLRAVDLQAKRLQEAEAERRRAEEAIQRANAAAAERRRRAEEEARRAAEAQARREAEELMRTPSKPNPSEPPVEQAPPLPPPVDIPPAPGQRRTNTPRPSPQASAERPAAERQAPRPAADIPANRSMLDLFLRPAQ